MTDYTHFIKANTRILTPPLVPEIRLQLAEESVPIWQNTEEELGKVNIPPPYWAFAWPGGQALARYILDHPEIFAGRRVLDLGSGSGITAIAAAKVGAQHVLAADIDEVALAAILVNAAENVVQIETTAKDLLRCPFTGFDIIVVGDLFYERQLADRVSAFLDEARTRGALIFIGDPQRSYFPRNRFECAAEYHVPVTRELEDCEIKRTAVWRY
jgi:predicted nicotinamide N-methyase